jgi:hypothetical protein
MALWTEAGLFSKSIMALGAFSVGNGVIHGIRARSLKHGIKTAGATFAMVSVSVPIGAAIPALASAIALRGRLDCNIELNGRRFEYNGDLANKED